MHEEEKNRRVSEEFKKRRNRQIIVTIPAIVAVFCFILLQEGKIGFTCSVPSQILNGILIALVIGLVVFSLKNWRCPACNGYLGKAWNPRFCQRCGVRLRD